MIILDTYLDVLRRNTIGQYDSQIQINVKTITALLYTINNPIKYKRGQCIIHRNY